MSTGEALYEMWCREDFSWKGNRNIKDSLEVPVEEAKLILDAWVPMWGELIAELKKDIDIPKNKTEFEKFWNTKNFAIMKFTKKFLI